MPRIRLLRRPGALPVVASLVAAALAVALAAAPVAASASTATTSAGLGSAGLGDAYQPLAGNGGYDVQHYGLDLRLSPAVSAGRPAVTTVSGSVTIDAVATQRLSRFDLDLIGFTVRSVAVDGGQAAYDRVGQELRITPGVGLAVGQRFRVVVTYSGKPHHFNSVSLGSEGWFSTADGGILAGEPEAAAGLFPVNDHPSDKATYGFRLQVPAGLTAVANGLPARPVTSAGWTTWTWTSAHPMASYLVTVAVGHYRLTHSMTSDGIPIVNAVDVAAGSVAARALSFQKRALAFLQSEFGPYPFEAAGAIISSADIPFALETQTRPVYPTVFFGGPGDESVLVHELAHQWFGDSLTIDRWREMWLNEGFATYAEWLWSEHLGGQTAQQLFDAQMGRPPGDPMWKVRIDDPGVADLFSGAVYERGAMTLHALRLTIGDVKFFTLVRAWAAQNRDGSVSTAAFKALAERVSGRSLQAFFSTWLHATNKPGWTGPPVA